MKKMLSCLFLLLSTFVFVAAAEEKPTLVGYYVFNLEELKTSLKAMMEKQLPEDQKGLADTILEAQLQTFKLMAVEITDKEMITTAVQGEQKDPYEVVKTEGDTITIKGANGESAFKVEKDKITVDESGVKIQLLKISKADFDKKVKEITAEKAKLPSTPEEKPVAEPAPVKESKTETPETKTEK